MQVPQGAQLVRCAAQDKWKFVGVGGGDGVFYNDDILLKTVAVESVDVCKAMISISPSGERRDVNEVVSTAVGQADPIVTICPPIMGVHMKSYVENTIRCDLTVDLIQRLWFNTNALNQNSL
jgi:hypothetical protein